MLKCKYSSTATFSCFMFGDFSLISSIKLCLLTHDLQVFSHNSMKVPHLLDWIILICRKNISGLKLNLEVVKHNAQNHRKLTIFYVIFLQQLHHLYVNYSILQLRHPKWQMHDVNSASELRIWIDLPSRNIC